MRIDISLAGCLADVFSPPSHPLQASSLTTCICGCLLSFSLLRSDACLFIVFVALRSLAYLAAPRLLASLYVSK